MEVNAHGSIHLDPDAQSAIQELVEKDLPFVVEGVTEEEEQKIDQAIDDRLHYGIDVSEEHEFEHEAAENFHHDVIFLDSCRSVEKHLALHEEVKEKVNEFSPREGLMNGIDREAIVRITSDIVGNNPKCAYALLDDKDYDKSFREVYKLQMRNNIARSEQEWSEDLERTCDGIATIAENHFDGLYEMTVESAEWLIGGSEMQEREEYWMDKLRELEDDGVEEINIVAGTDHLIEADNNFYSKMVKEGYEVNVQPIRRINRAHEESYIRKLHS